MENKLLTINQKIDDSIFEVLIDESFFENKTLNKKNGLQIHIHPYTEVFFVSNDGIKICTEEKEYFYKNCIVLIPPYFSHYSILENDIFRFLIKQNDSSIKKGLFNSFLNKLNSDVKIHTVGKPEETIFYLYKLKDALNSVNPIDKIKIEHLLSLILLGIFNQYNLTTINRNSKTKNSEYYYKIDRIINFDSFTEKIDLKYVANKLFLSEKQVSRIIKKEYGCTLSDLVYEKKLSAAVMLLKNTNKPISEIIREINVESENYFFVLFKKKYGTTPLSYRKTILINKLN